MTSSLILIGGATGGVAARLLLEKGLPVRAIVRSDDERAQSLRALGAETFVADLLDFRAVRRAFVGTKRAYFVYPMRPGLIEADRLLRPGRRRSWRGVLRQHVAAARRGPATSPPSTASARPMVARFPCWPASFVACRPKRGPSTPTPSAP
jgi:hypothetical protein